MIFFRCKYHVLTGKVNYPQKILPDIKYVHIIVDMDSLLSAQKSYSVHRSALPLTHTFNELGILREDAIPIKRIPGLSMNLLGSFFQVEDIEFNPKSPGSDKWDGLLIVNICDFSESIETIAPPFCPVFFDISNIHNADVPFERTLNKDLKRKLIQAKIIDDKYRESTKELNYKIKIEHAPTNLNYWHIELTLWDGNSDEETKIENAGSKWKEALCKQALTDVLVANAYSEISDLEEIPSRFYCK